MDITLLECEGIDVLATCADGADALMLAVQEKNVDCVKALLKLEAVRKTIDKPRAILEDDGSLVYNDDSPLGWVRDIYAAEIDDLEETAENDDDKKDLAEKIAKYNTIKNLLTSALKRGSTPFMSSESAPARACTEENSETKDA